MYIFLSISSLFTTVLNYTDRRLVLDYHIVLMILILLKNTIKWNKLTFFFSIEKIIDSDDIIFVEMNHRIL